jgi:hypothetical protein
LGLIDCACKYILIVFWLTENVLIFYHCQIFCQNVTDEDIKVALINQSKHLTDRYIICTLRCISMCMFEIQIYLLIVIEKKSNNYCVFFLTMYCSLYLILVKEPIIYPLGEGVCPHSHSRYFSTRNKNQIKVFRWKLQAQIIYFFLHYLDSINFLKLFFFSENDGKWGSLWSMWWSLV